MCRNIKPLFNYDPPVSNDEIHDASLQFVRKISGFSKPSEVNEKAFFDAVDEISHVTRHFLGALETDAKPHNRREEEKKAHLLAIKRFGDN
ncbi:MAG TPA: DUF2277 domain-containing protein [Candidatus Saccharimonadales bacterium]|nr:DUF2277 domain-containing protein [Candidatus Saccharimonadales bacterium]